MQIPPTYVTMNANIRNTAWAWPNAKLKLVFSILITRENFGLCLLGFGLCWGLDFHEIGPIFKHSITQLLNFATTWSNTSKSHFYPNFRKDTLHCEEDQSSNPRIYLGRRKGLPKRSHHNNNKRKVSIFLFGYWVKKKASI